MSIVPVWIKRFAFYAMQTVNVLAMSMWFFAIIRFIANILFEDLSGMKVYAQFFIPMLIALIGAVVFGWLYKSRNFFGVK